MSTQYLGDEASLEDLESHMPLQYREEYRSYKHLRAEAAFVSRIFVAYKPAGLTPDGQHREPEVLAQVKVIDFIATPKDGCAVTFENMSTGQVQTVGHVPDRLFNLNVFVSAAPYMRLRWDGRPYKGSIKRSLCFGLLIKQRTRSDNYSAGATMLETPRGFNSLYPNYALQLQYS